MPTRPSRINRHKDAKDAKKAQKAATTTKMTKTKKSPSPKISVRTAIGLVFLAIWSGAFGAPTPRLPYMPLRDGPSLGHCMPGEKCLEGGDKAYAYGPLEVRPALVPVVNVEGGLKKSESESGEDAESRAHVVPVDDDTKDHGYEMRHAHRIPLHQSAPIKSAGAAAAAARFPDVDTGVDDLDRKCGPLGIC
jgi:hypothetical protein